MWKAVKNREAGVLLPSSFTSRIRSHRVASLDLSNRKEIVSAHNGAINSLQVFLHLSQLQTDLFEVSFGFLET